MIAAEGERATCEALRASTDAFSGSPGTLQLRLLQLLHSLQTERSAVVLNLSPGLLPLPTPLPNLPNVNLPITHQTPSVANAIIKDSPMMWGFGMLNDVDHLKEAWTESCLNDRKRD